MYSTFLVAYLFLSWKRTTKHIISRNSMAKLRRRWLFKYRESTLMKSSYPYKRVSFLSEWSHKIPMVASKLNSGNNIQVTEQLYQYMHNRNCGFCCFFLLLFFSFLFAFFFFTSFTIPHLRLSWAHGSNDLACRFERAKYEGFGEQISSA